MRMRDQSLALLAAFVLVAFVAAASFAAGVPTAQEKPTPSIAPNISLSNSPLLDVPVTPSKQQLPFVQGAAPLLLNWSAFGFEDNPVVNGGYYFIPPDPIGAAGPNHVVNVDNAAIQWFDKVGTLQSTMSLQGFFSPLGPPLGTFCFDPKVLYDQYAGRFVVIALERWNTGAGDPANDSYINVAVSKTSDPNAGWWYLAIHSKVNINGSDTWADYPGLAVDDKAIYITSNMFTYPGAYAGQRLWIIDKAPLYAGGAGVWSINDPYGAVGQAGFATTTMPAHMYGALPANLGTYLISYSGLTYGGLGQPEATFVIEVTDPLGGGGGPFFNMQFVNCADIEDIGGGLGFPALPDAPQFGTAVLVEVNDRRLLDAVWRDNQLYATTTIIPNAGADVGQTTAHWWRIDTSLGIGSLFTADEGNVGAEDLGNGTYTFFPSVAVDKCGNMAIGFAGCNQSFYPGAYYTGRMAADAPGTVQPTGVLQAGTDYYNRSFGGSRNRWGDYSGCALDPDESTFWVYNEYAMTRGTIFSSLPSEDGRWDTHWGSFQLGCQTVSVAITAFDARTRDGAVELTASFNSDFGDFRVNVYRQDDALAQPVRYRSVEMGAGDDFVFVDRNVEPGKTYRYHIGAVDGDGEFFSPVMLVTMPAVAAELRQNEPNPFNPTTTIAFSVGATQDVSLVVYDATGRVVRTLVDGVTRFGTHRVTWDGRDNSGNTVGSGIYFYRLTAGKHVEARKMVLIK